MDSSSISDHNEGALTSFVLCRTLSDVLELLNALAREELEQLQGYKLGRGIFCHLYRVKRSLISFQTLTMRATYLIFIVEIVLC